MRAFVCSKTRFVSTFAGMLVILLPALLHAQEVTGTSRQPLTIKNIPNWTLNGNNVPICWETAGYDREKGIVKHAVQGTWEWYANVRFTGWDNCPILAQVKLVRIRITPQNASNSGAGGSARVGMDALSTVADNNPGVNLSFNPDHSADLGRVEYVGVHEFGHVLGYIHEQDTPGNVEGAAHCATVGLEANITSLTPYDRDSVMNYCNRDGNMKGNLTDDDIRGVQSTYGVRIANIPSRNSCASVVTKQPTSIAWGWNDGSNQTSFALFDTDKTKFLDRVVWSSREGGWGDGIKWFAGDFTGDGRTDIGGAWNDGGQVTLTMRKSTGSGFSAAHWAIKTGGWIGNAIWLPGDFNGDGKTDVAGIWNDRASVSIVVYISDGTKFQNPVAWSVRDGGWIDSAKWFVGDFNGDGRADIGAAWNKDGATILTIRQATDSHKFAQVHWSLNAGDWSDSAVFVAGDYNGDGLADVARLWNDLGQNSIDVSLSNGNKFRGSSAWSTRDGGWIQGQTVKWIAGDFNGDGLADIGAAWPAQNLNTLTVRQSTGTGFAGSHWRVNSGGWRDTATWCSGNFH